jgi:hypothetical protein
LLAIERQLQANGLLPPPPPSPTPAAAVEKVGAAAAAQVSVRHSATAHDAHHQAATLVHLQGRKATNQELLLCHDQSHLDQVAAMERVAIRAANANAAAATTTTTKEEAAAAAAAEGEAANEEAAAAAAAEGEAAAAAAIASAATTATTTTDPKPTRTDTEAAAAALDPLLARDSLYFNEFTVWIILMLHLLLHCFLPVTLKIAIHLS